MRALVIGLAGTALLTFGAEAKTCRLDGLEVVAKQRGSEADPKLIGARFRVVRQASEFKTTPDGMAGGLMTGGSIAVELSGKNGRFFVDQSYVPHSAPWISATSWAPGAEGSKVNWSRRDKKREAKLFENDGTFDVYGGPLSGLTLYPVNCSQ